MPKVDLKRIAGMGMHYKYYPFEYFLEQQHAHGLSSIELWGARPHFDLDDYGYQDIKMFQSKLKMNHLEVVVFSPECTLYNYNLCCHDKVSEGHSIGYFKNAIKVTAELGAQIMTLNCCGGARDEAPKGIFRRAVQNLQELADYAKQNGVILAVETVPFKDSIVINTKDDLASLLKAVDHTNVKAALDLTAAGIAGETMKDWFECFGDDLWHIHFSDGRPHGRLAWGDGLRCLEDHLNWINDYHYTRYLSLSVNDSRYYDNPEYADEKNMKTLEPFIYR